MGGGAAWGCGGAAALGAVGWGVGVGWMGGMGVG